MCIAPSDPAYKHDVRVNLSAEVSEFMQAHDAFLDLLAVRMRDSFDVATIDRIFLRNILTRMPDGSSFRVGRDGHWVCWDQTTGVEFDLLPLMGVGFDVGNFPYPEQSSQP